MSSSQQDEGELLLQRVRDCYWRLFGYLNTCDVGSDLTDRQVMFLTTLRDMGPTHPRRVSVALSVTEANVKSLSDRVVLKGFASRRLDPDDGRRVILSLTTRGEQALEEARASRATQLAHVLKSLSPLERRDLIRGLQKIAVNGAGLRVNRIPRPKGGQGHAARPPPHRKGRPGRRTSPSAHNNRKA